MMDRMDRLFDEGLVRSTGRQWAAYGHLPVDVYEVEDCFVVQANVPGVKPDGVQVTVEGDTLTIKAKLVEPQKEVDYILRERSSGEFARTLSFNISVDAERIQAVFEDGVLTLIVPKSEDVRPKKIEIKMG